MASLILFMQSNVLHSAALGGHLPCVKYLAAKLGDRKFDLNMKVESCLHKAVEGGSLRVVRYLIDKCGLDPKLQNGVSPVLLYWVHTCSAKVLVGMCTIHIVYIFVPHCHGIRQYQWG